MEIINLESFQIITAPNFSDDEDEKDWELNGDEEAFRLWQFKLSKRKKQLLKVKSRIKSGQVQLEDQDERLKRLQEKIAKKRAERKDKQFEWTPVKTAHLISKVFENCEAVVPSESKTSDKTNEPDNKNVSKKTDKSDLKNKSILDEKDKSQVEAQNKQCLYTADFHRFAIALYFFSPKSYFFLSSIAPMFPHRNYIRQWVTSGRVEKLFPTGVYREEFND